jgi:hypothetical protein
VVALRSQADGATAQLWLLSDLLLSLAGLADNGRGSPGVDYVDLKCSGGGHNFGRSQFPGLCALHVSAVSAPHVLP